MSIIENHGYDWATFRGTPAGLKWNRRDLATVDQAVALVPGRTAVVQAGGNLGVFAKHLAKVFATVYVFEPAPALFPILCANAPEPNVIRLQAALGDTRQLISVSQIRRTKTHEQAHEGITHVSGPGVIPTLLLDDLALPVCDLLYLDTEGYELFALRGAVATITRCRPVIAVEINQNIQHYGVTGDDMRAFLTGQGYRCAFRAHSDEVYVPEERT